MDFTDVASLRIKILGDEAKKDLQGLKNAATDIKSELTLLENSGKKGTVAYSELKRLQKEVNEEIKISTRNIDLQGASLNQMRAIKAQLNGELNKLAVGSAEWIAKMKEIAPVNEKMKETQAIQDKLSGAINKQPGLWEQAKASMVGYLAAFSFQRAIDYVVSLAREGFALVTNFDRMHTALKNVSASSEQYRVNLEFIKNLSNAYGQDLGVLTKTYTSFLASSNSVNLSLTTKQKIYESIIKAGSALMLSNDQIEGSLLAVSQMFSKGNVSAEELRGQLGERLPGAFGIMAKALGVNEKQLNKMLEQGQVLAEDALPKFAKALEETYGAKAQSNLETVGGQLNRLYTRLTNQAVAWNENVGATKKLAEGIRFLVDNMGAIITTIKVATTAWIAYEVISRRTALLEVLKTGYLKAKNLVVGQSILVAQAYTGTTIAQTEAQVAATVAARGFNAALLANPFVAVLTALTALWGGYEIYKSMVNDAQEKQGILNKRVAEAVTPLVQEKEEFNRLAKEVLNVNNTLETRKTKLDDLKKKYPDNLKGITDLASAERNLGVVIRATNQDFLVRGKMLENEVKMNFNNELASKAINERILLENKLKNADTRTVNMVTGTAGIVKAYDSEAESIKKLIAAKDKVVATTMKNNADLTKYSEDLTRKLNYDYAQQEKSQTNVTKTTAAELKKQATAKEKAIEEDRKMWIEYQEDKEKFNKKITEAFKKLDEEYTKWLFDEYEKRSKIVDSAADAIQKNIEKHEKAGIKASGERNKEALQHLSERIFNFGKSEEDRINKDTKLNIDAVELKKRILAELVNFGLDAYSLLLEKATEYFTKIAETSESSSKRMNAAITNEFIKPMTDNLNAAKAIMQGDFVGAAQGLIGYFKGMWDVTIGLKKTLKEVALIEFNKTFEADFAKLSQYNDQIKAVFGDLANATSQLQAAQDNSLSGRIAAELKVGEKIKENYALATEKENAYYETRRKAIEDAYSLEVQRINDKYSLLSTMASMQFSAESLAIQAKVNEDLMRFITNEDTKQSLTADYQARKNEILAAYASQIKPITEGMSQTEIDGINAAIKARDEQLARVEAWFLAELQYVIANEEQKRKVYSETELIIQKGKEATDLLAVKYAADELERQTKKNLELVAAENTKNAGLEAAAKTHNDTLVALGVAKDAALVASFDKLRDAMLSGYAAMEAAATEAYNKGLITAAQFEELINRANSLKNLVTGPVKTYDKATQNDLQPGGGVNMYAGGTNYVDAANRYPNGVDTVPAYLTKGERVVPQDLNRLLGGMSNEQLVASLYRPSASLSDSLQNSGLSRAGATMLMDGGMVNYVSGSAVKRGQMQVVASGGSGAATGGGADGGMAENNKLMAALIDLIAGQTNAELRKIAQKPNLSLHDVENAAAANGDLNRLSNF